MVLGGISYGKILLAFKDHMSESPDFPTPADIMKQINKKSVYDGVKL